MFHPSSSSTTTYSDLSMHHALSFTSALPTAPTEIPCNGGFIQDKGDMFSLPNVAASASAPPPYYSSLPPFYIHRSTSSQSFPLYLQLPDLHNGNATFPCSSAPASQLALPPVSSSLQSSSGDFLEFSSGTLRRVFSTGDLQVMNVPPSPPLPPPPLSGDSCSQEVGGPFSQKVGRYSAEERKERIERYRVKRHQRNFHKKITYACRKTLADSRPRVQGRFARNAETEGEAVVGMETEAYSNGNGNGYEYCAYNGLTNSSSSSRSNCYDGQWWEAPEAAGAANWQHQHHEQQLGFHVVDVDDDDELWASLADM
ncbi:hypothetical protein GUJ93_ZPchr0005g15567 [Zizania palustris]|uniref:CCT domain-containing protein n=1 Tax=Zizania palustris TaxID=103762 RepID=A0A8J5T4Q3_ZIZPA|nr:hypothetical protein GUJ93_ZPchr0005g15567 [Zizania palustris]